MDPAGTRDDAPGDGRSSLAAHLWPLLWVVWLPALIPPIAALLGARPAPLRLGTAVAGLALFVVIYLWAAWQNDASRAARRAPLAQASWRWRWGPGLALILLGVAFVLGDGPRWLALFIFATACVAARLPLGQGLRAVAALMLLIVALGWLTHDPPSDLALAPFWAGMTGGFVMLLNYLQQTNRALRLAREENARLAVTAERLRIARDLHDLLGHNLAHIALKSEVAEALALASPDQAAAAMREVGDVARTALQEVRAAVAGYRQPTLASELRGAREILAAAGIAYRYEGESVAAPPAIEAALAWTVREGVTNVVKHSRARHCTIRVTQGAGQVAVEVRDDGPDRPDGPSATPFASLAGGSGSGLPGLTERVTALGGRCAAGPLPGGGFRLSVTLPTGTETGTEIDSTAMVAAPVAAHADAGGQP